jgi:putative colanic acid biosynthesis glycosyltransferase
MKFSIITVTRNNLDGLKVTHASIGAQIFSDFEWIVIDGASDDGTPAYLATTHATWVSEPDHGIYDAMNKGLDRARGDYVLFLNAGDTLVGPDILEHIAKYDADFIYGDSLEGGHYKRARSHRHALTGMFTHHQAMFYKRAPVTGLRFDTAYRIAADYKFTLEALRRAQNIHYAPLPLCHFEPGGLSQQQAGAGRMEQFRIRRALGFCSPPVNTAIMLAQTALMGLRRHCPGVYWAMKRAHNSRVKQP